MTVARIALAERFWPKVDKRGPDECWPWRGKEEVGWVHARLVVAPVADLHPLRNRSVCQLVGDAVRAERSAAAPAGPDHAVAENAADCVAKGRQAPAHLTAHHGEDHGRAKLTDDDVRAIRRDYRRGNGQELATKYGVTTTVINRVVRRLSWKHIPPAQGEFASHCDVEIQET